MIIAFDCGNPEDKQAEGLCKQIIGENIPNVVVFRPRQQPRALPNDYRSDNQIITYLYNLMQPAVRYLEEINDCEDFVADDTQMNVVLFGNEPTGSFDQVADLLREFARFGKTRNEAVIEELSFLYFATRYCKKKKGNEKKTKKTTTSSLDGTGQHVCACVKFLVVFFFLRLNVCVKNCARMWRKWFLLLTNVAPDKFVFDRCLLFVVCLVFTNTFAA